MLGATDKLSCMTTAKGDTKTFNNWNGSDSNLSELTLPTALAPDLQALAGSNRALRLLILWLPGSSTGP